MSDLKQVCIHFMSGTCKYGPTCTKVHVTPTSDILQEIEKKGPSICNYYPNCKFTRADCKKLHIDQDSQFETQSEKEFNEFRRNYFNIINLETSNQVKLNQIERIKFMVKTDMDMVKDTWLCLSEK